MGTGVWPIVSGELGHFGSEGPSSRGSGEGSRRRGGQLDVELEHSDDGGGGSASGWDPPSLYPDPGDVMGGCSGLSAGAIWRLLALCMFAGLVGAGPRALALAVISNAAAQKPMPQAVEDFESAWAPCKSPRRVFTGYSPNGQLFQWSILSDHTIQALGLTIAYIGALHAMFPGRKADTRGGRIFSWELRAFCLLGLVNFGVWVGLDAMLYRENMTVAETERSHVLLDFFLYSIAGLFAVSYLILANLEPVQRQMSGGPWRRRFQFTAVFFVAIVACLYWCLFGLHGAHWNTIAYGYFGDTVIRVVVTKLLMLVLRVTALLYLDLVDRTTCQTINVVTVFVTATASVAVRKRELSLDDQALDTTQKQMLGTVITSAIVCAGSMLHYALASACSLFISSAYLKYSNLETLDRIIVRHEKHQVQMELFCGLVWSEELAEVCVCWMFALQELAMPIWNQPSIIHSYSDFRAGYRVGIVFAALGIRLAFQVGVGWSCLCMLNLAVPVDMMSIRGRILRKPALVCFFGIAISQPIFFWPYAQLCNDGPLSVLLYTECLRTGAVQLGGIDRCKGNGIFRFWNRTFALELMDQTGTTEKDFGCSLCGASEALRNSSAPLAPTRMCDILKDRPYEWCKIAR